MKQRLLGNLFLIASIIFILLIIYIKFFSSDINITPFGIQALQVRSNSMYPEFEKNDIIIIKKEKEYKEGDIITYRAKDNSLITHRIIEKTENGYYTKGDNNNTKDEDIIMYCNILGKVIWII